MFILIICIGGIVYKILDGTPFAKYDRKGNIIGFMHIEKDQNILGEEEEIFSEEDNNKSDIIEYKEENKKNIKCKRRKLKNQ